MFLFTVLVAVGADYNIFLVTRIEEEQRQHGAVAGIQTALVRTGRIISSCGLVMAATFASLAVGGKLTSMVQLGVALSTGVLLDTFIVRPILVPAFMLLVQSGRFGWFGKFLGAPPAAVPRPLLSAHPRAPLPPSGASPAGLRDK
jgi:RND superfamily putative drug exporter